MPFWRWDTAYGRSGTCCFSAGRVIFQNVAKEQITERDRYGFRAFVISKVASVVNRFIESAVPWICSVIIAWVLGGKVTAVGLSALVDSGVGRWAPWILVALFAILWGYERKKGRDRIESMHPHQTALESKIDPRRSASGLTARGLTPRDKKEE